ncbi:MAG: TolC family protein [Bacteroidota bacterium]
MKNLIFRISVYFILGPVDMKSKSSFFAPFPYLIVRFWPLSSLGSPNKASKYGRVIKKSIIIILCLQALGIYTLQSQEVVSGTLLLEQAYQMAKEHYPLIKDANLIDDIEKVNLEAIKKKGLPQVSLNGTAQAQTENIEFPIGDELLQAPLETWNTFLGIDYDIYDGGAKKAQKKIEMASAQVQRKSLEVQLRSLKDRVNTLLFAISLSRKQKDILETSKNDLETNIATLEAGFENGTVLESEVSKLKVRRLELVSNIIAIEGDTSTYFNLLEQLTGKTLSRDVQFVLPAYPTIENTYTVNRPEQDLFNDQKSLFAAREASIAASTLPKISFFAQGGVGNPNPVNFADFSTSPYALGGVRLKWNFLDFGKGKKEKQSLRLQQKQVEVDRELFLFDIESNAKEYREKMEALEAQIQNDETIVTLQKDILEQSKVQLDNGVINSSDYVTQINTSINAEQELEFNKIQLQQLNINYLTLIGKL